MKRHMLDTNMVSHLIRGNRTVLNRVMAAPMASLCISAITHGELQYGLAKRPEAHRLHRAVQELMLRLDVMPWDDSAACRYGSLRAGLEAAGKTLAPLDLLIAGHALGVDAVLVTNDRAFCQVPGLNVEDWSV